MRKTLIDIEKVILDIGGEQVNSKYGYHTHTTPDQNVSMSCPKPLWGL